MRRTLLTAILCLTYFAAPAAAQNRGLRPEALPVLVPDLERIVDTYVPVMTSDPDVYYAQLRREVIPWIRSLQERRIVRWYAFLLHGRDQVLFGDRTSDGEEAAYVHLFLEPETGMDLEDFMERLPPHFLNPEPRPLGSFAGVDGEAIRDGDWAYAWKGVGEASDFVLRLLENYGENPVPQENILQYLHFITNALYIGSRSLFLPEGPAIRF